MARRLAAAPALLVATALLAGACGTDPAPSGGPGDRTISLVLWGGPVELAAYQQLADAFGAVEPDVTVEVTALARQDDLLARLTTGFAAGTPPDVFLVNFRKFGLYAALDVLRPVQEFIDSTSDVDLDDYFPAALDAFRFDGTSQTCLPQNVSSLVTYVNRDLFAAAGVELPAGDWDWDQFLAAATAISDPAADVFGIGTDPSLIRLAPMVWSNGGDVVNDPREPTALTLEGPEARAALEFFASLVPSGAAPDALAAQARDAESRFLEGSLGMYWSSRADVPAFREGIDSFAWDVVPFPLAPGGERVTMLHSDAFCIARAGASEDAWKFVAFALGDEGATILAESGRTVPSNVAVANSPAFLRTDLPPANAQVFLDNVEIVRATPSTATWNEVEGQADDILAELFYGRMTLDEAIARLGAIRFR